MSKQNLNFGVGIDTHTGDTLDAAMVKVQHNFVDLYPSSTVLGDSSDYTGTIEQRYNAAIAEAIATSKQYVLVSQSYNTNLVTNLGAFSAVGGRMIRNGGDLNTYDVRAYGASGDGVTDDLIAFSAAMTAAGRIGGIVRTGSSVFLISGPVAIPNGVTLLGDGIGATTIKLQTNAVSALFLTATNASNVHVEGIKFDGGSQTSSTVSVQLDGTRQVRITRCAFYNCKMAVWIRGSGQAAQRVFIEKNYFDTVVDYAVRADEANVPDIVHIIGNDVLNVTTGIVGSPAAFKFAGTRGKISRNTVAGSSDTGVMVSGATARDTDVCGNDLTTTKIGVFVGSGARRVRVSGNNVTSTIDHGINVFDTTGILAEVTISANDIHDCGKCGVSVEGVLGVSVTGNTIARVGTLVAAPDNQRAGIATVTQSGFLVGQFTATGNVIYDDAGSPTMRYGIFLQSVSTRMYCHGNSVANGIVANYLISAGTTAPYYYETDLGIDTSEGTKRIFNGSIVTPIYGATITIDCALGSNIFSIVVTNGTAFTISNPANTKIGQEITIMITNTSGGAMGAITWGANFRLAGAFTNPANNQRRVIKFFSIDGTSNWFEIARSSADQPL